jgi:hypothetical protein
MNRFGILAVTTVLLLTLGVALPAGKAVGQEKAQQTSDVERVNAASQVFMAAISVLRRTTDAGDGAFQALAGFCSPGAAG